MATQEEGTPERQAGKVRMDASSAETTYCNFVVAQDSPEEVVLNLGLTQQWNREERELKVKVLQQVIMNPAAARRLRDTLIQLFERRDARPGPKQIDKLSSK